MNNRDHEKLLKAGYRIIRADDSVGKARIKELRFHQPGEKYQYVSSMDWYLLESFETKAARNRAMAELLNDPKIVED